jgi:hypothetical protein
MFYIMLNVVQYLFEAFTIVDFYVLLYHAFCWLYKVLKTLLALIPNPEKHDVVSS